MQDKTVTLILQQAAQAEGSAQALASRLRAPEATLLRWIDGRAQTPLRAFLAVLEFLMELERKNAAAASPAADLRDSGKLVFALGRLFARCDRCDGTEFRLAEPGGLRLTSRLACCTCGLEAIHGNLLAQLAKDAVHQSRAVAVRTQRTLDRGRATIERARRRLDEKLSR